MTGGNPTSSEDCLAPRWLVVPTLTPASLSVSGATGSLLISGAKLYLYNGTAWEMVTSA